MTVYLAKQWHFLPRGRNGYNTMSQTAFVTTEVPCEDDEIGINAHTAPNLHVTQLHPSQMKMGG
jgi:hypothetical protein